MIASGTGHWQSYHTEMVLSLSHSVSQLLRRISNQQDQLQTQPDPEHGNYLPAQISDSSIDKESIDIRKRRDDDRQIS